MADPKQDLIAELGLETGDLVSELGLETNAASQRTVDKIPQSTHEWAVEGLKDAANVAPAGATFDRDDEIAGHLAVIGEAIKNPLGFNRASAGKAYDAAQQSRQASKDQSDQRSPKAAIGGRVAGGVAASAALGGVGGAVARTLPTVGRAIQTVGGVGKAADGASKTGRIAQWAANAAVPGAIQGSDSGNAAEGAAYGVGGAALAALPGGIVRGVGNAAPAVAKWADRGADKTYLEAYGFPAGAMAGIGRQPGGQAEYVQRMRELGMDHKWPTPVKGIEKSQEAADLLNKERQVLADSAPGVAINSNAAAGRIRRGAQEQFAEGADRDLLAKASAEADVQAGLGTPVYAPRSGAAQTPANPDAGNAVEMYSHQSPVRPDAVDTDLTRERSLPQVSKEISAYNDQAYNLNGLRDARGAQVPKLAGQSLNDEAEEALNKVDPGLGSEWRGNKRDTADVLRFNEAATEGDSKPARLGAIARATRIGGAFGVGAIAGGPAAGAVTAVAGELAAQPAARMHAYRGVGAVAKAAANKAGPNTALGRFLARAPGNISTPLGGAAGRGLQAVREAAERGPDALATEHFIQNQTNSAYNKAVNRPDDDK